MDQLDTPFPTHDELTKLYQQGKAALVVNHVYHIEPETTIEDAIASIDGFLTDEAEGIVVTEDITIAIQDLLLMMHKCFPNGLSPEQVAALKQVEADGS